MKRALLIGINYIDTDSELAGCINDVLNVKTMLTTQFNYDSSNIVLMTDLTETKPTRQNIINALNAIIQTTNRDNGELWIHYSGHGTYTRDRNLDESDRYDEAIVPVDYETAGILVDDDIHKIMTKLRSLTKTIVVFDSCHSGTAVDLPFCYKKGLKYKENKSKDIISKVLMISGCRDNQTSADTVINGEPAGALTGTLLNVLKNANYNITINTLCDNLWKNLASDGYTQYPILSSSQDIVLTDKFCADRQIMPSMTRKHIKQLFPRYK